MSKIATEVSEKDTPTGIHYFRAVIFSIDLVFEIITILIDRNII